MCLYRLDDYREWSLRLASPSLMPLAAQFFRSMSKRRRWISRLLGGAWDRELEELLEQRAPHVCETCR